MTTHRIKGHVVFECDSCGEAIDSGRDWDEALADVKEQGWQFRLSNGEWNHFCSDCGVPNVKPDFRKLMGER